MFSRNSVFFLCMFFLIFLLSNMVFASSWWNTTWTHRLPINITDLTGENLIEYQVNLNITHNNWINSNFSDIRFTFYNYSDETEEEVYYWINNYVESEYVILWIKVPFIPSGGNSTIYMYYGNSNANTISNFSNVFIVPPKNVWNRTYDSGGTDAAESVAVDSDDNVIVTGYSDDNYFTIKYDENGTELWNRTYDSGSIDRAYGITTDSKNNVIITGYVGNDYFTIKYDENGTELWNRMVAAGSNYARGVAVDSYDNVIVTGFSDGNYFTIKYDENGTELWNRTYDSGATDKAYSVAVDSCNNIIVTGESNSTFFTIKYDENGTELWNRTYATEYLDRAYGVAVDSQDNIVVTGESNEDYFTIKYDENGTELWSKNYDRGYDYPHRVAVDSQNNVIVTGSSNDNYFTIKYDKDGNILWTKEHIVGVSYDQSVTIDSEDNILLSGKSLIGGNYDYFVIKFTDRKHTATEPTYSFGSEETNIVDWISSFSNIEISPDTSDEIDPGTTINVTANLSEGYNIDTVILQWKEVGEWNNVTMSYNNSTGFCNGSFNIDATGGVYYYRLWVNDTFGHDGVSSTKNLTADWDYSWTVTPDDFGTVSGFISSIGELGILAINNTGDDALNFTITNDWSFPIYFNGTSTTTYYLDAKEVLVINVTVQFADSDSEDEIAITITATHPTENPSPQSYVINATLNSYTGGPYFESSVYDYPTIVYQSQTINLKAKVKNIGNETATGTWINWTLPAGWINTTGNIFYFIGNITNGSTKWSNLTVSINPSLAYQGIKNIYFNVSSSEGISSSGSVIIGVECNSTDGVCGTGCTYLTDSDCSTPSGGGGGAAVVGVSLKPELLLFVPDRTVLTKGETYKLSLKVSNPNAKNITKIKWGISGYPETLVKEEKPLVTYIPERKNKTIILEIDAPPYIEERDYFVTISVGGLYDTKYIENSQKVVFSIHGIVENESLNAINDAKTSIEKMKKLGFKYDILDGLLEEANVAYNNLDFDKAKELAQKIIDFQEKALKTYALINQLKGDIILAEKYNIDVNEAKKMTTLAEYAFKRGDYKRAENRITSAMIAYQMETKDILPLMQFLSKYWSVFLILIILILFFRKRILLRLTEARLKKIVKNKKTLKNLIKILQKDYFINKKISKFDYILGKQNYEKRMAQIISEEAKTFKKIALLKGKTRKEGLILEKEILEKRIKEIQGDYFKRKKIGKNEYKEILEEIQRELALVEKDIKKIDRKKLKTFLIIFLLFIIFSSSVNAEKYTLDDALKVIKDAEGVIAEMKETGLGTDYANHTLQEAKLSLSRNDYDAAVTQARYVFVIKEKALHINEMIDETESRIYELSSRGYDTSKANELFQTGLSEFESENYEEAEKLLNQAMDNLDEIERKEALSKASESIFNKLKEAVIKNWLGLTISVFIILLISLSAWWKVKKVLRVKKIRELENEIKNLKKSIKHLQEKYFIRKIISRKNYDIGMSEYKKYLNNLMEELENLKKI